MNNSQNLIEQILSDIDSNKNDYCINKLKSAIDFFDNLGYKDKLKFIKKDEHWISLEVINDRRDSQQLAIDIKYNNRELDEGDISYKAVKYIDWGIICDGRTFYLVNNDIKGDYKNKIVFKYDTAEESCRYMLKYFEYESLFKNRVANYFKHIAQYKALFNAEERERSWKAYENTLTNFFSYLAGKGEYYNLELIRPSDFRRYIINEIAANKELKKRYASSKATIINKFAHINGFFETLKANGVIKINNFDMITEEEMLKGIELKESQKPAKLLTVEEIQMILDAAENTREPERNKLIILLLAYCGLDRDEIKNLKIEDVNVDHQQININNRMIPIIANLTNRIDSYIKDKTSRGDDSTYLFSTKYGNKYNKLSDSNFNIILNNTLKYLPISEERKNQITLSLFKESLIRKMIESDYHIEDIVYITGLSLNSIDKYILAEDIKRKADMEKFKDKHPYSLLF